MASEPPICVLGASGFTGRLIAQELAERGRSVVACGRDRARVEQAVAPFRAAVHEVRTVDVSDPDSLDAAFAGISTAITAIGPYSRLGAPVVDSALRQGVALLDVSGEQGHVRWVHEQRREAAARAGVGLLPGGGFTGALGTLLGAVAAEAAGSDVEVHASYTTAGAGGRGGWSAGTRSSVGGVLGATSVAYRDGALVDEPLAAARRLAWFPRPVGPRHAAAFPGIEAVALPGTRTAIREVHTYLAVSTWKAELAQAIDNLSRLEPVRRWIVRRLEQQRAEPSSAERSAVRWACVAEAKGDRGIARAWANGRDPYGTAAAIVVDLAEGIGHVPGGVWGAADVREPGDTLDRLSSRGTLRWALVRPEDHRV